MLPGKSRRIPRQPLPFSNVDSMIPCGRSSEKSSAAAPLKLRTADGLAGRWRSTSIISRAHEYGFLMKSGASWALGGATYAGLSEAVARANCANPLTGWAGHLKCSIRRFPSSRAAELSWLERVADNDEVTSSNLVPPTGEGPGVRSQECKNTGSWLPALVPLLFHAAALEFLPGPAAHHESGRGVALDFF